MIRLSKREKTLVYITAGVVLSVVLLFWVILPLLDKWLDLSYRLATKEQELKEKLRLVADREKIEAEFSQFHSEIVDKSSGLEVELAPEDSLPLEVNRIIKSLGINLTNMRTVAKRPIEELPNYIEYTLPIDFECNLQTLGLFFEAIQKKLLYINNIRIMPKGRDTSILSVHVGISKLAAKESKE